MKEKRRQREREREREPSGSRESDAMIFWMLCVGAALFIQNIGHFLLF